MLEQIQNDEDDWERSRADIPIIENDSLAESSKSMVSSHLHVPKMHGKLTNMTEFSGFLIDSASDSTDMSIGRYFSNRCQDLQAMIPTKSPTKKHTPVALLSTSFQQGEFIFP